MFLVSFACLQNVKLLTVYAKVSQNSYQNKQRHIFCTVLLQGVKVMNDSLFQKIFMVIYLEACNDS